MLQIHPCIPHDTPNLTSLFLAAFSDAFNLILWPRTPDVRAWWEDKFRHECSKAGQVLLKVVDSRSRDGDGDGGEIVAFALWKFPVYDYDADQGHKEEEERKGEGKGKEEKWPQSSPSTLCERFFGGMAMQREKLMGTRPHYYNAKYTDLDMLATHPAHHGRGIASLLLKWGLERADRDGIPVFLSASPAGKPIYERRAFRVLETEEVVGGYVQAYMVRDA